LKVFDTQGNTTQKNVIRIVKWGENGKPLLEKRNFFMKDEDWLPGKAKGFTSDDFSVIAKNNKKIKKLLNEEE